MTCKNLSNSNNKATKGGISIIPPEERKYSNLLYRAPLQQRRSQASQQQPPTKTKAKAR